MRPVKGLATGDPIMAGSLPRWASIILAAAAVLVGVTFGLLEWWKSQRLAEDHASRAQKALNEMGKHYATIRLCKEQLKTARLPTEKARYESLIRSSRSRLVKLEEATVRHERLRRLRIEAAFKRPESDSNP